MKTCGRGGGAMEGLGVMVQLSGGLAHGVTPVGLRQELGGSDPREDPVGLGRAGRGHA